MWLALLLSLALADDVAPAAVAPPAVTPPAVAPPAVAPPPPPEDPSDDPDAEVEVFSTPLEARAREALALKLREEGYAPGHRQGSWTIYKSYTPYHPDVRVHDDGWISVKRSRPRVHPPGESFASDGPPWRWALCAIPIYTPGCISLGGMTVSPARLEAYKEDVYVGTHDEVQQLQAAVTAHRMIDRMNTQIPAELEGIWTLPGVPAEERRAMLLAWWDSRTDTPEGEQARRAAEAFFEAVVQTSDTPFTDAEISAFNARRKSESPLSVPPAVAW